MRLPRLLKIEIIYFNEFHNCDIKQANSESQSVIFSATSKEVSSSKKSGKKFERAVRNILL